jgi:hypothetical protein
MSVPNPEGTTARRAWRKLDEDTRRQVYALARQGKPHPDPTVAGIAYGWARQVGPRLRWRLPLVAPTFAVVVILTDRVIPGSIGWSLGGTLVGVTVVALQVGEQWWLAQRVKAANAPPRKRDRR